MRNIILSAVETVALLVWWPFKNILKALWCVILFVSIPLRWLYQFYDKWKNGHPRLSFQAIKDRHFFLICDMWR